MVSNLAEHYNANHLSTVLDFSLLLSMNDEFFFFFSFSPILIFLISFYCFTTLARLLLSRSLYSQGKKIKEQDVVTSQDKG